MIYKKEEVILKAENVSLFYDKQILRDINFQIQNITRPGMSQGQVVSLVGRSGIGKTQLFKILAGLLEPTSGIIKIGTDLHPVTAGEVGVVPQNYILFNHRTILDNLKLGMRADHSELNDQQKKDLIRDYAEKFELTDHLKKYPMMLSGGQRQRVSIIQQILTGNKFILLDEPFSGLDPVIKERVIELFVKISLMHELTTLVIVSHDIESSFVISDTAFILGKQPEKEGATITETIDLIDMGFAWQPDIRKNTNFMELVAEMKHRM